MAPKLYHMPHSAPSRAVLMTAKVLELELEPILLNIMEGENLKPEYIKKNPMHTIPTLEEDDGFVIWESHAILPYLVKKYGKTDQLYPKDPKLSAIIDQRLHFDSALLGNTYGKIISVVFREKKEPPKAEVDRLLELYGFLERFLEGHKWIAGDTLTVADISIGATLSSSTLTVPFDKTGFPNLTAWFENFQNQSFYEINKPGLAAMVEFLNK